MHRSDDNCFISANELAELLNVNRSTIWRWRNANALPAAYRISPKVVRWHLGEIKKWMASRERGEHVDKKEEE